MAEGLPYRFVRCWAGLTGTLAARALLSRVLTRFKATWLSVYLQHPWAVGSSPANALALCTQAKAGRSCAGPHGERCGIRQPVSGGQVSESKGREGGRLEVEEGVEVNLEAGAEVEWDAGAEAV